MRHGRARHRRLLIGALATTVAIGAGATIRASALAQEGRSQVSRQGHGAPGSIETNDEMQPTTLPPMPPGMTTEALVQGDSIFHGKGGCFACHGTEGEGLPAAGDAITVTLSYAQPTWRSIDSLVTAGIPDALTRSPISMPWRGARGDLTDLEIRKVAAYVWAISQVRGEPWPGGHTSHVDMVPPGSTAGTARRSPGQGPPQ